MSRRQFVGGLTKAGLTVTAAQSVLASVSTVSLAEGTPPPARCRTGRRRCGSCRNSAGRARGRRGRRRQGIPGPWRRGLRRAAHRVGREIRVRQFGQRGRAVLRGAGRPAAAQIHPDAARGPRRRDGVGLHQGLRRARDRDAGRGGRHGQRHRPDVQRLQGADAARRLFLSHRSVASRRPRRLRGGAQPGADGPADHQVHLAGAPSRHDSGNHPPRVQGVMDAALWAVLHFLALRL